MTSNGGLATRRQLLQRIPGVVLDGHIGRGQLVRVFPVSTGCGMGRTTT
jgi:hypothetical protein